MILYRLAQKKLINLPQKSTRINFKDTHNLDEEFQKALELLVANQIFKWDNWYFYPWEKLNWIQFLAVIGRLFWNQQDWEWKNWYTPYIEWAYDKNLIPHNWKYLKKPIPRKEVLNILGKLIFWGWKIS